MQKLMVYHIYRRARYFFASIYRKLTQSHFQYDISPRDAVNIFGVGFAENGPHFMVKHLKQRNLLSDESCNYSYLRQYHNSFQPHDTNEALGLQLAAQIPLFVYPWGVFGSGAISTNKKAKTSRFCGPSDESFITKEIQALDRLLNNVSKEGYNPTKFPHSYIQGVWLTSANGERRFVVLQGNHRMAILAHLGYKKVTVRTDLFAVKEIREDQVCDWPLVKTGEIHRSEALKVFKAFFKR